MAAFRSCAFVLCIVVASTLQTTVTPVEKVITLLKALKMKVQGEGKREAAAYDTFACFCKDSTSTKSTSIKDGTDNIDQLSADIESKTATKNDKEVELEDTKKAHEKGQKDLAASKTRCAKEKAEYLASDADLSKAISSLGGAVDALVNTGGSRPGLLSVRQVIAKNMELADALKLVNDGPHWGEVRSFLETSASVDPDDPQYKYHSQGIIHILSMLKEHFTKKKGAADDEWSKADKACQDEHGSLDTEISRLDGHSSNLKVDISKLKSDVATHREDLVKADGLMKDDQLYLKDLTKLCELRANEWDQRTQMRAGELAAIEQALDLLQNGADNIKAKDEKVNERALLLQARKQPVVAKTVAAKPVALLEEASSVKVSTNAAMQARQHNALEILRKEGGRIGSAALSALAVRAASDPFEKVKDLIQKLVERLIQEATDEATKKGFCDESLAKARQDRTFRWEEVLKLNGELSQLEAKKQELEFEIDDLGVDIEGLDIDLRKATGIRATEKANNLETIDDSNAGLKAVSEAIIVLKTFYADALKAGSFVQTKLSPVEADNPGAGFEGVYQGQQKSSDGIIGLLEVIKSDFERTTRKTTQAEKESAADFVLYDRATKADISGKSQKKILDEEDFKTTKTTIAAKMEELSDNMDLVDKANGEIEELRPMCIDSGMSYEERVQKREDEVAALKKALCILDPDKVEAACQSR